MRRMLDWRLFRLKNGWYFYVQNEKSVVYGNIWQLYNPKLRVNRLRVIRICKVCESMRFDSGPEGFVCANRNYVLTEYVLNENDCIGLGWVVWKIVPCVKVDVHSSFYFFFSRHKRCWHETQKPSWAEINSFTPVSDSKWQWWQPECTPCFQYPYKKIYCHLHHRFYFYWEECLPKQMKWRTRHTCRSFFYYYYYYFIFSTQRQLYIFMALLRVLRLRVSADPQVLAVKLEVVPWIRKVVSVFTQLYLPRR